MKIEFNKPYFTKVLLFSAFGRIEAGEEVRAKVIYVDVDGKERADVETLDGRRIGEVSADKLSETRP